MGGCFANEACNRLRYDPAFLGAGTALDEHFEVEPLRRQALQGVVADRPKVSLIYLAQETLFEIGIAQLARVVVAKDPFDVGSGEDLADDVEHGGVVQGVANLVQLVEEPLEDATLDRVGGDEVEDEAIVMLAIAVDAAHPLLQPVGIPGDVVVEQDVAAL